MPHTRIIKVGKQTYLRCNIKSELCKEENGCVKCNDKHWPVIEKVLHPLLQQCITRLKDKDTIVEFYGSAPYSVDDLNMNITYELKPHKVSFFVVQPRSDDKTWENAWSNISDDRSVYNNFGGLFEHVYFLNYILQVNISKKDELSDASISGSDNQMDNEEKSSYFKESRTCESNPLAVLKGKHLTRKRKNSIKCDYELPEKLENNTSSVDCAHDLVTSSFHKSVINSAADVMSFHTLHGDSQKENREVERKTNIKQLSVVPKKKNISNNLNEEFPVISNNINSSCDSLTQLNKINISSKTKISRLMEANPIKEKAESIDYDVMNRSHILEERQDKVFISQPKDTIIEIYKDSTEIELPSLIEIKRKEGRSDSSLNDSSTLSESSPWLNKLKNKHKNRKSRLPTSKCMKKKSLSQNSGDSKRKINLSLATNYTRQKVKVFTDISSKYSPKNEKEKVSEEVRNNLNYNLSRMLTERPKNPLKCKNGDCYEQCDFTLPNLDESTPACSSVKTLKQASMNKEARNKSNLYPKRKCSPVSSQRTKKKQFSVNKTKFLSSTERMAADSSEKDDNTGQISRLRKLFLDIVSKKKTSNTKELPDTAFLESDLSPIRRNNRCIDDVIVIDDEYVLTTKQKRLVSNLTKPQLYNVFKKHLTKLKDIFCRKEYCRRHEDFVRGGKANYDLTFQVNLSPFKEEQLDYIMELLMSEFYMKPNHNIDFILKVLLPEALIIIFMDFHGTDYENSDRLMAEAAFNDDNVEIL